MDAIGVPEGIGYSPRAMREGRSRELPSAWSHRREARTPGPWVWAPGLPLPHLPPGAGPLQVVGAELGSDGQESQGTCSRTLFSAPA